MTIAARNIPSDIVCSSLFRIALFVYFIDIYAYTSPDAVCYQNATYAIANHFIVYVEEAGEKEHAYHYIDKHHKDVETDAEPFGLAGLGII